MTWKLIFAKQLILFILNETIFQFSMGPRKSNSTVCYISLAADATFYNELSDTALQT